MERTLAELEGVSCIIGKPEAWYGQLDDYYARYAGRMVESMCKKADRLTRKNKVVEAEVFRLQAAEGHVNQTQATNTYPSLPSNSKPHVSPQKRVSFQTKQSVPSHRTKTKRKTVSLDEIKHKGTIFGRHHLAHDSDGCPWHMTTRVGCNKGEECTFIHEPRSQEPCPIGINDWRACPQGAHCRKQHKDKKYLIHFQIRGSDLYSEYVWVDTSAL